MRYRINWTEAVGYYAYVQADSKEEALTKFNESVSTASLDGFCEMQDDAEAEEDPDEECDGCNGTGTTGGGPPGSASPCDCCNGAGYA